MFREFSEFKLVTFFDALLITYPYFFATGVMVLGFPGLQQTLSFPVSTEKPHLIGGSDPLKSEK